MSSGRPPAAIAIIRVSGPQAFAAATALAGSVPPPRQAGLRALRNADGDLLDRALVLCFPGPNSATGEDLVELHCHGGRAVVDAVEVALLARTGVRRAQPGEFTRRALLNGRIDLTEAAGLADLLEAETETQRRAALAAAEGQVSRAIRGWLERLTVLSAQVEASIDYAEEGDVEAEAASLAKVAEEQVALAADMQLVLAYPPVERWRDGYRVVIAGPPNAGKSTLLNLLGGREAAIVSPVAGTTRDRIELSVKRDGVAYVLTDTAGLRDDTDDAIERTGMDRAMSAMVDADLILWLGDEAPPAAGRVLHLHARADLPERMENPITGAVPVSALMPASIEQLWSLIGEQAEAAPPLVPLHRDEWDACHRAVTQIARPSDDVILQAEQLRRANVELSAILGVNATEQMLDALFGRFCVGK